MLADCWWNDCFTDESIQEENEAGCTQIAALLELLRVATSDKQVFAILTAAVDANYIGEDSADVLGRKLGIDYLNWRIAA